MIRTAYCLIGVVLGMVVQGDLEGVAAPVSVTPPEDATQPIFAYATDQLTSGLEANGYEVQDEAEWVIDLELANDALEKEGFRITTKENRIRLQGGDGRGVLYSVFSLLEQIERDRPLPEIEPVAESARFPFRAIKFNLPWNSYRRDEALATHREVCRDLDFWEAFLDMMARNRFNTLTLWSLHPFHRMVRPKQFPEACPLSEEALKDWQAFWHQLFALAQERGIETYLVNWNIFTSPAFAETHNVAEYSISGDYYGDGDTAPIAQEYNRQVVTQVLNTYPALTGLGISVGERMGGMTHAEREEWLMESVIAGMEAADRPAKLIHRAPFSAGDEAESITREAIENRIQLTEPIRLPIKFNWSHGHSTPTLVHAHGGRLTDTYWEPAPKNYEIIWTVRNEDFFALRWGQPDFVREHIRRNGHPYVGGYILGSETYIPAQDYFSKENATVPWDYAFERQWLFYKLWGRLLYHPQTADRVFEDVFIRRYGTNGPKLFEAVQRVSRVPLRLASFCSSSWDFTLYSEGFLRTAGAPGAEHDGTPFISLEEWIAQEPLDPRYMSTQAFIEKTESDEPIPSDKVTPLDLAERLEHDSRTALKRLEDVDVPAGSAAWFEREDAKAWAYLGLYFGSKLRAGVALQRARHTERADLLDAARQALTDGIRHWDRLVSVTKAVYDPMPLTHLEDEPFHWSLLTDEVRADLEALQLDPQDDSGN